ncbi:AAA family ATPase [Streptomyces sp. NPDC001700]
MRLVERADEFALLEEILSAPGDAPSRVIAVTGPVASGKSELLNFAVEQAEAAGFTVLRAIGLRRQRRTPMAVLGQLLLGGEQPLERSESVLKQIDAARFSALLRDPDSEQEEHVRAHTLRSLTTSMVSQAQERPVVIAIDDVHYADIPSLQCLQRTMEELRTKPAVVVLAWRTGLRLTRPLFGAALLRHPGLIRLPLTTLSARAVAELLRECLDDATARRIARDVHRISGGNPLLVRALVQDLLPDRGESDRLLRAPHAPAVGHTFRQAVLSCLHRVEPSVLAVARGLALFDGAVAESTLTRLLELSPEAVALSLRELEAIGLVHGGTFRCPTARHSVLADLPPDDRAALHLRAADLLQRGDTEAPVVTRQVITADAVVDAQPHQHCGQTREPTT